MIAHQYKKTPFALVMSALSLKLTAHHCKKLPFALVASELRSCVKVEVDIVGSLYLIVLMVSVDIKQLWTWAWSKETLSRSWSPTSDILGESHNFGWQRLVCTVPNLIFKQLPRAHEQICDTIKHSVRIYVWLVWAEVSIALHHIFSHLVIFSKNVLMMCVYICIFGFWGYALW